MNRGMPSVTMGAGAGTVGVNVVGDAARAKTLSASGSLPDATVDPDTRESPSVLGTLQSAALGPSGIPAPARSEDRPRPVGRLRRTVTSTSKLSIRSAIAPQTCKPLRAGRSFKHLRLQFRGN